MFGQIPKSLYPADHRLVTPKVFPFAKPTGQMDALPSNPIADKIPARFHTEIEHHVRERYVRMMYEEYVFWDRQSHLLQACNSVRLEILDRPWTGPSARGVNLELERATAGWNVVRR